MLRGPPGAPARPGSSAAAARGMPASQGQAGLRSPHRDPARAASRPPGPRGGPSRTQWGRGGTFISTSVHNPNNAARAAPQLPQAASRPASVHPINGQARPEPGADLLTQAAGLPHPVRVSSIGNHPTAVHSPLGSRGRTTAGAPQAPGGRSPKSKAGVSRRTPSLPTPPVSQFLMCWGPSRLWGGGGTGSVYPSLCPGGISGLPRIRSKAPRMAKPLPSLEQS